MSNLVTITIDGQTFKFWENLKMTESIDSIRTFEFTAPFDPDNSALVDLFKPMRFRSVEIKIDEEIELTGRLVSPDSSVQIPKGILVTGYSEPGMMGDSPIPATEFPIEYNDQTLRQIAETISSFYSIEIDYKSTEAVQFDRVAAEPGKKGLDFLIELANDRGLIISDDSIGKLVFKQASTDKKSVANFREGESPVLSIIPDFNPQNFYTSITGLAPGIIGGEFESVTIENQAIPSDQPDNRPFVYKVQNELFGADLQKEVKGKAGRMFSSTISLEIIIAGWRNKDDELIRTDQYINVLAPSAMIYTETLFLIKDIERSRSDKDELTIKAVLPGSFTGEIPTSLPWD